MTTKIQDLKRQSFELAQSHTTTTADLKDHVSVLLETVRIKQDEIKTTLSYLDADTISQMQLDAKKIFIKNFKDTHPELIDTHKRFGQEKRQIRKEKNQIIEAMNVLHEQALEQGLTDLSKEQFIRMLTMTQQEIKQNVHIQEDALLQNIADMMETDRDQIDILRNNFNDGSNYSEDPLSSLRKVDRMVSNASSMGFLELYEDTILAMNKSQVDFLLAACKKHPDGITQVHIDGDNDKLDLSIFDDAIKTSSFLIISHISRMNIEQLQYIEHACRTHQLEQSDASKKICPTNKMIISLPQAESIGEDRKNIILALLQNTQELIISENLINDLYGDISTLLEQVPDIRELVINHTYDDAFMQSDEQKEEIKKKGFSSEALEKKGFTFSVGEDSFIIEKME